MRQLRLFFPKGVVMPEYESSMKHFSVQDRRFFLVIFVFWSVVLVGSYQTFGGYDIWMTRLLTWITVGFGLLAAAALIDGLWQAAEYKRHRRNGDKRVCLGNQNWFWASDRDPGNDRVV